MSDKPDFDQARLLAESQYVKILEDLGLTLDRYGDAKGVCPVHGGDNNRAFSYCSKRHTWQCFTHKCHKENGTSIIALIKGVKELGWPDTIRYVEQICGKKINSITHSDLERRSFIKDNRQEESRYCPTIYPESILLQAEKNYDYFIKRGCSREILKLYDNFICTDQTKPLANRSCFPIRDEHNRIVGFIGRSINDQEPKWKFIVSKYVTDNTLFGFDKTQQAIKQKKTTVLVEGCVDQIMLTQQGIDNAVCTFGTNFYEGQRKLLLNAGVQKLILAYDPDPAGIKSSKEIEKQNRLLFDIINLTESLPCDPGEMNQEQITDIFGNL